MDEIIRVEHLDYIYQEGTPFRFHALKDISLTVRRGEVAAIIGPTGSGKSTLIQHFNGLLQPTRGSVYVNGRRITDSFNPAHSCTIKNKNGTNGKTRKDKKRDHSPAQPLCFEVGLVFQYPEYQLFEETVYDDIAFGPRNMHLPVEEIDRRVRRAMEWMGLAFDTVKDRSPFALSGGEMRRVALAGILAMEPQVLVLDEPTAGLDPRGKEELFRRIMELQKELCLTLVMVSHEMGDVVRLANHLIIMQDGKIAVDGNPSEVFTDKELIRNLGLELPAAMELLYRLKEIHPDINTGVLDMNEVVQTIAEALKICAQKTK